MFRKHKIYKRSIVFSKWSGKNYAIFASLGKLIKIARLAVDICVQSLKKNHSIPDFPGIDDIEDITNNSDRDCDANPQPGLELQLTIINTSQINAAMAVKQELYKKIKIKVCV